MNQPGIPTLIAQAISKFPPEFGLRAFPGLRFRLSSKLSEMMAPLAPPGKLILVTEVQRGDIWSACVSVTPQEIHQEMVEL